MTRSLLTRTRWTVGLPAAVVGALALSGAGASAAPLFGQCPPVGNNQGCSQLIVVSSSGVVVQTDPAAPAMGYDGSEDTLIGIQNNTSAPISSINLASPTVSIFGFDSDGLCNPSAWPSAPATTPPGCPGTQGFGSTGYEGPNVSFTNTSSNNRTGTVVFTQPVPPKGSAYWGLEEALQAGQLQGGAGGHPLAGPVSVTKSAASFLLTCVGSQPCTGSALLTVLEKISGKRVRGVTASKRHRKSGSHTKRVVIGSTPVSAAGGDSVPVTVTLNAAGRRLAATLKSLPATVSVVLNQATGGPQVTNVATVKFPGTKKAKARKRKHR